MKFFVLLLLFVVATNCMPSTDTLVGQWGNFKTMFNKSYKNAEEERNRFSIFKENMEMIEAHNVKHEAGEVTYNMGINQFTDMTNEEFLRNHIRFDLSRSSLRHDQMKTYVKPLNALVPDKIDWRDAGFVTPVKNQGRCGSCWAFSATGSLEGQFFKKTGKLVSLSEQNLMDCDKISHGCNGGLETFAFEYVKSNGGIDTEESYPYEAKNGECRYNEKYSAGTITGITHIKVGSEEDLKNAVATAGPVSIGIDASKSSFQNYKSGVYNEPHCNSTVLDHSVLAVGYGTDAKDGDYWIVKNSWSASWGEEGYIKIARNKNNMCGVATDATYPNV